jgi:hypothetical protein
MMKRGLFFVMAAFVLPSFAQPKIELVGGNKFAFGNVNRGKMVDHKIVVKNVGDKPLEIGKVDVSCGCTGAVASSSTIAPGKTGEIGITFNSTNFTGQVTKAVTINSNAANEAAARFEFTANVIQELAINPQQFWFKDAEVGRVATATISISNNSSEPVTLSSYNSGLQGLTLKLPKDPIAPGKTVDVAAELKAKAVAQVLNDGVSIQTTSKNEPNVYVRIFGSVKEFKFQ